MLPPMRISTFLTCALLVAGCATVPTRPLAPAPELHAVDGTGGPEVEQLAAAFYAGAIDPAFSKQLAEVLAKYPDSSEAHEIAGYFAILQLDDDAAWEHFARAAADRKNPRAELALRELPLRSRTEGQSRATIALLRELAAQRNAQGALAAHLLAALLHERGELDAAEQANAQLGFARELQLIGAFENDEGKGFSAVYPPEKSIDLQSAVPGKLVPVSWRAVPGEQLGMVPVGSFVSPSEHAVAYLVTWVHVDAATSAQVRLTSSAPVVAWLNDALVARDEHLRHSALDNVVGATTLRPGWNKLLVKTAVKKQSWWLGVRLTDPSGGALTGLTWSSAPQATPTGAAAKAEVPPAPHDAAGAFAAARLLALTGHLDAAQQRFSALRAKLKEATVLRYFAAVACEENEQVERALDLLGAAIKSDPNPLPAFLELRAGIYRQKQLRDQAQADLERALKVQPGSRTARIALAELFANRGWQHDREETLKAALARWPDSPRLLTELAEARESRSYHAEAESLRKQALALAPGLDHVLRKLRDAAVRQQDYAAARAYAAQLQQLDPFHVGDALERAELERITDHPDRADATLTALLQQNPDLAQAHLRRALLAEDRGDEPAAVKLLAAAQDRNPDDTWLAERLDHLRPANDDATKPYVISDEALEELLAKPPPKSTDPAAQVQELLRERVTQVNADGSAKETFTIVARALNQQGRDALLYRYIGGGKSRVRKAFAVAPDGTRVEASSVSPVEVRFRSLDEGSTVVLQYVRYTQRMASISNEYFRDEDFGAFARSLDRVRWVVLTGQGRSVNVEASPAVQATVTSANGWDVRTFSREHVRAYAPEPHMAPADDVIPHVRLSTIPSWDTYVAWEKAILLESFPEDPQVDALAAKLTSGARTPAEKLEKLYAFVAQEIRYQIEYESIVAGWQPHRSSVVLERKYGDCKDKATLLIALARSQGIDLDFAVLATHRLGHPDRQITFPDFDHAIVYVPPQPGIESAHFLDPTVDALDLGNLREDDQGQSSLVLDPRKGSWRFVEIPYQAPEYQRTTHQLDVTLAPDKVLARDRMTFRGSAASEMRVALRNQRRGQQMFEGMAHWLFERGTLLDGKAPDHEDFSKPLQIELQVDASATVQHEGSHSRLKLPPLFGLADMVTLAKRETPLDLRAPWSQSAELHAVAAEGLQLLEPPAPFELQSSCFKVKRTVSGSGRELTVRDELQKTCTEVTPEQYASFRADVQKAYANLDGAVLFGPAPVKAAKLKTEKR